MIKFKISEEIQQNIHQITSYRKTVGQWDFKTNETKYSKSNLIRFLSFMLNWTGSNIQYPMSMLFDKNTNQIEQWDTDKGSIIDWVQSLDIDENEADLNPFDFHFSIYLESPDGQIFEIKDGGVFMLIFDQKFEISLWIKTNLFSTEIFGFYNDELKKCNRLLLGKDCASYNRNVLYRIIANIREYFNVVEPTLFESECMSGCCEIGFKDDCSQFRA